MAWRLTPLTPFVDRSTPVIDAVTLNEIQAAINDIFNGAFTLKRVSVDGTGDAATGASAGEIRSSGPILTSSSYMKPGGVGGVAPATPLALWTDSLIIAAASMPAAGTTANGAPFNFSATVGHAATGVYVFTVGTGSIPVTPVIQVTFYAATGTYYAARTSATQITVSTFAVDGTTATDKAFSLLVLNTG